MAAVAGGGKRCDMAFMRFGMNVGAGAAGGGCIVGGGGAAGAGGGGGSVTGAGIVTGSAMARVGLRRGFASAPTA